MRIRKIKRFIIDRKIWLRGEDDSYLLRKKDKKQCCVGIFLNACGVTKKALRGLRTLDSNLVLRDKFLKTWQETWTKSLDSGFAQMYSVNDNEITSEYVREKAIKGLFSERGISVSFKGRKGTESRIAKISEKSKTY